MLRIIYMLWLIECFDFSVLVSQKNNVCVCVWGGGGVRACVRACVCVCVYIVIKYFPCI